MSADLEEIVAADLAEGDKHYVRHVTEMGDKRPVVTSEHIETRDGMRLVRAGTPVNSALYDKLIKHKLLSPLDTSLSTEGEVGVSDLLADARRIIETETGLAAVLDGVNVAGLPLRVMAGVTLKPPLAFKMTVCREQAPAKYDDLLRVALISLVLGSRLRMGNNDLIDLATAGLFHDLGELHVDPRYFELKRALIGGERRQIYAHPIIGYLILKEFPLYHPVVSRAVLHHHERLDGSGYPKGIGGGQISKMGCILGAADLVSVMLRRGGEASDPERIIAMLQLNAERYGPDLVEPLVEILSGGRRGTRRTEVVPPESSVNIAALQERIRALETLLLVIPASLGSEVDDAARFITQQCERVLFVANDTGLSPVTAGEYLDVLADDPGGQADMDAYTNELVYQVVAIAHEVRRRWVESPASAAVAEWLAGVDAVAQCLESTPTSPAGDPGDSGSVE